MGLDILSPYLVTILVAWLSAHAIKYVISVNHKEKRSLRAHLFISGGMPSSHSATVVAMTTIIGLKDGVQTGLFGLSVLFSMIVMYDAMKVRRSAGEQGEALVKLIKEGNSKIAVPRIAKGHEPIEVLFGALLGLLVGLVVFLATK